MNMAKTAVFTLAASVALFCMAGCGGGAGGLGVRSASLSGTVLVPAGTPTRGAASGTTPLPGASVQLYDVTSGAASLASAPAAATTTDANGNYQFSNLNAGDSYVVNVSKTVTGTGGAAVQLTLGTYAHAAAGTTVQADTDQETTAAASYVLQQIGSGALNPKQDLTTDLDQAEQLLTSNPPAGGIDLTKDFKKSSDYQAEVQDVEQHMPAGGAYTPSSAPFDATGDSVSDTQAVVDAEYNTATQTITGVIAVFAPSGDNTDFFTAVPDSTNHFQATTADGLYTITGSVNGEHMEGSWSAAGGSAQGQWEAGNAASMAYSGTFGSGTPASGSWMMFTDRRGGVLLAVEDSSVAGHASHTLMAAGALAASGSFTATVYYPTAASSSATPPAPPVGGSGTASATPASITGAISAAAGGTSQVQITLPAGVYESITSLTGAALPAAPAAAAVKTDN